MSIKEKDRSGQKGGNINSGDTESRLNPPVFHSPASREDASGRFVRPRERMKPADKLHPARTCLNRPHGARQHESRVIHRQHEQDAVVLVVREGSDEEAVHHPGETLEETVNEEIKKKP